MLNYLEVKSRLIDIAEATKAQVFYDMKFDINSYKFFSLKFQSEVHFQNFFKRYAQ